MNLETQLQEGERELARIWKVSALRGVLAIVFAVVILIWPDIGLTALIALFGAFALVSGVASIVGAFSASLERSRRAWLVFDGLLGVVVGIVVFVWPDLSALGLLSPSPRGRSRAGSWSSPWRSPSRSAAVALAAARAGGRALGRVRRDHVLAPRCGSTGSAGARRGVRACDRCHADRIRDRAEARRRRPRPAPPGRAPRRSP